HWAAETPDQLFLAERAGASGGCRRVTYSQALAAARSIGQALLNRKLSPDRPVAILSDNSIDHALLALGAMHVGVTVAPISPAYSLLSKDYDKLKYAFSLLTPGLVFVANGAPFAPALRKVGLGEAELVCGTDSPEGLRATEFRELLETQPTSAVDEACARVGPDTIAKILFSSGSTDLPKGVINTQRMLCSNQRAIAQAWPFLSEKPPVLVDWLPWNHTFGGNFCFNMMLYHGGTLYIDEGKATPQLIKKTVANLREISPTLYFNVPRGFDMLLSYLEQDEVLRANFFRHLDLIFYAAAALPQNLWERLEDVSITARGKRVPMVSAWGSTETAPAITMVHFEIDRAGVIGLPLPGCEVKMVPNFGKMELRIRGPNITPGYWKRDDLTKKAFDDEGFYCIGDAGRLADTEDPAKGLEFDGRVAEDFKLSTATWVSVGAIRVKAIAAGEPIIQDVVVAGHDREEVGLLVFPSEAGCRSLCPDAPASATLGTLIGDPRVRARVRTALETMAAESTGSSNRPTRALLMEEPPSIDANEITDKGYINQRAVLTRRAALVERLYADEPDAEVIRLTAKAGA
ncbi:MAG TPA: feruloyl-CoA synthase, partial [Burkholderiales bacterium]|nr:feruloyl-CoA synthase [Burkholderiales bacterium]